MSAADLSIPLRAALVGASTITTLLAVYKGSYPIFTRRPAPADAPYPMIMVSPDISLTEQDGIDDFRPIQERDIIIYGQNDTPAKYRVVEQLGYAVREIFHSNRQSITVSGWGVILITARGPIPAPTDDDQTIARMVSLTIELAKKA
jgi:hypothetical protein